MLRRLTLTLPTYVYSTQYLSEGPMTRRYSNGPQGGTSCESP